MDIREYASYQRWWDSIDGEVATFNGERIPIRFVVCPTCRGKGQYVNPSIDSHGITMDEMDELGEEFIEDYRSGFYNIPCGLCEGHRVVPEPIHAETRTRIMEWESSALDYIAMVEAERRVGA